MGVDYSYTVGYGIVIPEDILEDWCTRVNGEIDYIPDALDDLEFPEGIGYVNVGNHMGGDTTILVVIGRLTKSQDFYEMDDTVYLFNDIKVSDDEYNQLCDFVEKTWGFLSGYPSHFAAGTIS